MHGLVHGGVTKLRVTGTWKASPCVLPVILHQGTWVEKAVFLVREGVDLVQDLLQVAIKVIVLFVD
jgi:hypothetical protein